MRPDLREYAGLCAELETNLVQALAQARVVHFCVRTSQSGPITRAGVELNARVNTIIDLLLEITKNLNAEGIL